MSKFRHKITIREDGKVEVEGTGLVYHIYKDARLELAGVEPGFIVLHTSTYKKWEERTYEIMPAEFVVYSVEEREWVDNGSAVVVTGTPVVRFMVRRSRNRVSWEMVKESLSNINNYVKSEGLTGLSV